MKFILYFKNKLYLRSGSFIEITESNVEIVAQYKDAKVKEKSLGALKYPQLVWGMLAIFVYVGVEVTVGSNLGELLKDKNIEITKIEICLNI